MAGLICFYDTNSYCYLFISGSEEQRKILNIMIRDNGKDLFPIGNGISVKHDRCHLRVTIKDDKLRFSYSTNGKVWLATGKSMTPVSYRMSIRRDVTLPVLL